MDPDTLPLVSVIVPCFNERQFIAGCLDSVLANSYPKDDLEILVIDGMSTDGSRDIVAAYAEEHAFIRLVDNPDRIKPKALNLGIRESRGEIVIRLDAHAVYDSEYIAKSVRYLREYNADNVGGIRKTLPGGDSVMARAIAHSISSPFAAGNAIYRTGSDTVKWVDTVFGGCYPREVFERIGLFNEALIRGQDREFNVRLRRSGGKILLAPDILCYYYARGNFWDFLRWIFVGGLTPLYISRIIGEVIFSWRNLMPLFFVLGLLGLCLLSLLWPIFWWLLGGILVVYLLTSLYFSLPAVRQEKNGAFFLVMPLVFCTTHLFYGLGSLVGVFKPVEHGAMWSRV